MYALFSRSRKLNLPIDIQIHLFDILVVPILLYGCEIWGFENNDIVEKLHLKFCKIILNINKTTPSCMVYGELGRFPLNVYINNRIANLWSRLVTNNLTRSVCIMYRLINSLDENNIFISSWTKCMLNLFSITLGFLRSGGNRILIMYHI